MPPSFSSKKTFPIAVFSYINSHTKKEWNILALSLIIIIFLFLRFHYSFIFILLVFFSSQCHPMCTHKEKELFFHNNFIAAGFLIYRMSCTFAIKKHCKKCCITLRDSRCLVFLHTSLWYGKNMCNGFHE